MESMKSSNTKLNKSEISLSEIFRILKRRKSYIIYSVLASLVFAMIFNIVKQPVYESSVLFKKEILFDKNNQQDRIQNLLGMLSQDEVETEMQLIQTRSVINQVIKELSLNINITKVIEQDGTVTIIDLPLAVYENNRRLGKFSNKLPSIKKIFIGLNSEEDEFSIKPKDTSLFIVENLSNTISKTYNPQDIDSTTGDWEIQFNWPDGVAPGEVYFEVEDYSKLYKNITDNLFVDKKIKTNIFEVVVNSNYPYLAKEFANTLAEKYQASRFSQNKDNIKYSFNFIDERLTEISQKLTLAEDSLSSYKTNEKIADIDEQSKKIVQFLSDLESEKLKNDLELGIYRNRIQNIKKQMKREGFVDQTYLTPEQYQSFNSPFSTALNELSKLEIEKLELLQRRTEFHPDVQILTEKITKIKEDLTHYNNNTLSAIEIISNSLQNKKNNLHNLISKYTIELQKLPGKEAKLASLIRDRDGLEKMYNLLLDKREEMRVAELSRLQDILVVESAFEPKKAISPNKKLNLFVGLLFGLVIGIILAFINEFTDDKINDISEIEKKFNYPILSVIPPFSKSVAEKMVSPLKIEDKFLTLVDENFNAKEAFRMLESKIMLKVKGVPKIVMITSCEENSGKTTSAINLAITAAQSNKKVLLIDCDIKNPSIAVKFELPKYSSGLVDFLIEKTDTPNIYKPVKLSEHSNVLMNLDIIPTGEFSNISGEILASERMKKLLNELDYYDLVILDTPPLTRVSDTLSLSRIVKDTILVVRPKFTVKESVSWAINELKDAEINFHGLVVNDCEVKSSQSQYKYGYTKS